MARPRAFDTDRAVRAAREVFWRQGYAETSVPDLERVTGLRRSSLYAAFGSKRGLFDAAVTSYLADVVRPRLTGLLADPVAPGALADYLGRLHDAIASSRAGDDARLGCLLVNTAGADLVHDDSVRAVIAGYHHELLAAVARGVAVAVPGLPEDDVRALATEVAGLVVASMLMSRVDHAAALDLLDLARSRAASAAAAH